MIEIGIWSDLQNQKELNEADILFASILKKIILRKLSF